MLFGLISLLVFVLTMRVFAILLRLSWNWLGRGREIQNAVDRRRIDPAIMGEIRRHHVHLSPEQMRVVRALRREDRRNYFDQAHLGWYQIFFLFAGGAVAGLVLEQLWMWLSVGSTDSRVGLVWGPFSPLYGFGTVFLTFITFGMRRHGCTRPQIFIACALAGGLLEQLTGWGMQTLFDAQSWTYAYLPDKITQWVCWRSLILWGLLGLAWCEFALMEIIYRMGEPTTRRQVAFVTAASLFLSLDIFMTVACFQRRTERDMGIPAANAFEQWIDVHYSDQFMASRFQNLVIGEDL